MNTAPGFQLGDWEVLPLEGKFIRIADGESRHVRRKAMDVLTALAEHQGQVVERDILLQRVWGQHAVTDEPLTSTIAELRRLLDDPPGKDRRYIETVPKRGYRLLAPVEPITDPATPTPAEPGAAPVHTRRPPLVRLDRFSAVALLLVVMALGFAAYELSRAPATAPPRSIAVLPFETQGDEPDQAYLGDGLAEELIALLTRMPELRVAARNSAFSMRDKGLADDEIARQLNVAHILSGSVRRDGDRVRVTVQLVDALAGYQRWSTRFDRPLENIFAIQDEIAGQVAEALRLQLSGEPPRQRATDPRAYALYLQARFVGRQHTADGLERAAELYRQVLEIDPGYQPAWTDLAGIYVNLAGFAAIPAEEGYRLAREAALEALAIDPAYAPAHDRLGWLALHADGDLAQAAAHYQRALALAPESSMIRENAAVLAVGLAKLDAAIKTFEEAVARDPVSPIAHANLANAYLLARRYDEAEASIRTALTLSPDYAGGHYRLARALLAKGDIEGARDAIERETVKGAKLVGLALIGSVAGDVEASDAALAQLKEAYGDLAAGNYAQIYAVRGDVDRAFEWLEIEVRQSGVSAFLEYREDPLLDPLRQDLRWPALLERIGISEAQIATIDFSLF